MTRRGFLRRLGLAPVAVPLAVQAMATTPSLAERTRAWYRLVSAPTETAGIAIGRRWAAAEDLAFGYARRFQRTQNLMNRRRLAKQVDDVYRHMAASNPQPR